MARIPRRSPLQGSQLSTQAPAVRTQPGALSRTAQASQELLQKTQEVAQRFEDIQRLADTTNAKTTAMQQLADINREAIDNPEIMDSKTVNDRISKIKSDTTKSISMPADRNAYEADFDAMALSTMVKTDATRRKRSKFDLLNKSFDNIDELKEQYKIAGNTKERMSLITRMENVVNNLVATEAMNPTQGRAEKAKQNKAFIEEDVNQAFEDDLKGTVDQLELGEEGIYGDVDSKLRQQLLTTGRAKLNYKRTLAIRKDSIQANEIMTNFFLQSIDPNGEGLQYQEVVEASQLEDFEGNKLLKDQELRLLNNMRYDKRRIAAVAHRPTYIKLNDIQNKIVENKDEKILFEDIAKFRQTMTKAVGEGRLKSTTAKIWTENIQKAYQAKLEGRNLLGMESANSVTRFLELRIGKQTRLSQKQQDDSFIRMSDKLMKMMDVEKEYTNQEVGEIANALWKEEVIINYPKILGFPENGQLMIDVDGSKAIVFPDGTVEETFDKPKESNVVRPSNSKTSKK